MKIGVLGHGLVAWGGGIGFLSLITNALVEAGSTAEIHVFLPLGRPARKTFPGFIRWMAARRPGIRKDGPTKEITLESFAGLRDRVNIHVIEDGLHALEAALRSTAIDVMIPVMNSLPASISVPWVGYIYDFQHRYLPGFFTEEEIHARDAGFLELTTRARAVVVNSRKVKSDIGRFIPGGKARVFTMPFTPFLDQNIILSESDTAETQAAPYFIICNQFWIHKDHGTAMRAFAKIAKHYQNVDMVCTGYMNDYRAPDYVRALLDEIDRLGIGSRVKLLGMVPKSKQMELLRKSLALIQPTLFEGGPGGGAVYDAAALGVPALVSNIEVNREVDCGDVRFFEAGNADELAQLMGNVLKSEPLQRPDLERLRQDGKARLAKCGSVLLEALAYVRHGPL